MPATTNGPIPTLPNGTGGYQLGDGNVTEPILGRQGDPGTVAAVATLTTDQIIANLIVCSGTSYTVTTPTAAQLDAAIPQAGKNSFLDFSLIVTASGTITLGLGTGVTAVGTMTAATATATRFRLRKTNAQNESSAWIVYRLA